MSSQRLLRTSGACDSGAALRLPLWASLCISLSLFFLN